MSNPVSNIAAGGPAWGEPSLRCRGDVAPQMIGTERGVGKFAKAIGGRF
jgi:hypothetical protein